MIASERNVHSPRTRPLAPTALYVPPPLEVSPEDTYLLLRGLFYIRASQMYLV